MFYKAKTSILLVLIYFFVAVQSELLIFLEYWGQKIPITLQPGATVGDIKRKIAFEPDLRDQIGTKTVFLSFGGRALRQSARLADEGVSSESVISVNVFDAGAEFDRLFSDHDFDEPAKAKVIAAIQELAENDGINVWVVISLDHSNMFGASYLVKKNEDNKFSMMRIVNIMLYRNGTSAELEEFGQNSQRLYLNDVDFDDDDDDDSL